MDLDRLTDDFSALEIPQNANSGDGDIGCVHYIRKCKIVAPCCREQINLYSCRFCHDAKENHRIDRKSIQEIECNDCRKRQPVSNKCQSCGVEFGSYFCAICRLYDNNDTAIFHCDGCTICRIGVRDDYFHCETCKNCLPVKREKDDGELGSVGKMECGHPFHVGCFVEMEENGIFSCFTCATTLKDKLEKLAEESPDTSSE